MRLIDADAIMRRIGELRSELEAEANLGTAGEMEHTAGAIEALICVMTEIEDAPTIEAGPGRHGGWIERRCEDGYTENDFTGEQTEISLASARCSKCLRYAVQVSNWTMRVEYEYCPHCGAKMDGGEGNDER